MGLLEYMEYTCSALPTSNPCGLPCTIRFYSPLSMVWAYAANHAEGTLKPNGACATSEGSALYSIYSRSRESIGAMPMKLSLTKRTQEVMGIPIFKALL